MESQRISSSQTIVDDLQAPEREIRVGTGVHLNVLVPAVAGFPTSRHRRLILEGDDARASVFGLYAGQGAEALRLTFDIVHAGRRTVSRTLFKGLLLGKSSLDLDGVIKIEPEAHGADALLEEHALLLSTGALATATPSLEIKANDIRCKHAATAGPVDPEQVFYLRSRGLTEAQAEALIVKGFVATILGRFDESWQNKIERVLAEALALHA